MDKVFIRMPQLYQIKPCKTSNLRWEVRLLDVGNQKQLQKYFLMNGFQYILNTNNLSILKKDAIRIFIYKSGRILIDGIRKREELEVFLEEIIRNADVF